MAASMRFFIPVQATDELTVYPEDVIPGSIEEILKCDEYMAEYWVGQVSKYPKLLKILLRIFATSPSSSSRKRHFSLLNKLVSDSHTRLESDIIEDIVFSNSALKRN